MDTSHLPLKIRARYGNLAQTFDRRPLAETADDFQMPVPHVRFLFARRVKADRKTQRPR